MRAVWLSVAILLSIRLLPAQSGVQKGKASYYGDEFTGRRTASGEKYDPKKYTAAHRTYAFGTLLKVTNPKNGSSVVVKVNDRGPFSHGRIIDLSRAAAKDLGIVAAGVAEVTVEVYKGDSLPAQDTAMTAAGGGNAPPPAGGTTRGKAFYHLETEPARASGFGVQIAAYNDMTTLLNEAANLKGKPLIIQPVDAGNRTVWRLIVGQYESESEATAMQKLLKADYKDCYVVRYAEL